MLALVMRAARREPTQSASHSAYLEACSPLPNLRAASISVHIAPDLVTTPLSAWRAGGGALVLRPSVSLNRASKQAPQVSLIEDSDLVVPRRS